MARRSSTIVRLEPERLFYIYVGESLSTSKLSRNATAP